MVVMSPPDLASSPEAQQHWHHCPSSHVSPKPNQTKTSTKQKGKVVAGRVEQRFRTKRVQVLPKVVVPTTVKRRLPASGRWIGREYLARPGAG